MHSGWTAQQQRQRQTNRSELVSDGCRRTFQSFIVQFVFRFGLIFAIIQLRKTHKPKVQCDIIGQRNVNGKEGDLILSRINWFRDWTFALASQVVSSTVRIPPGEWWRRLLTRTNPICIWSQLMHIIKLLGIVFVYVGKMKNYSN